MATGSPSRSGSGARSTCRAGFVVEDAGELPAPIADYVERLVGPYFEAIGEWYEALHVGQTGGVLHDIIARRLGDPFFGIFLNPGHQIGLDEWVNSPIFAGSTIELRSGMAFQVDVIPATGTDYFTTNIEDGIALADASLREAFAAAHPAAWARIEARRTVHGRRARDRAPPGRPAVLEHPGLPAAVPAPARPGDDAGRLGQGFPGRRPGFRRPGFDGGLAKDDQDGGKDDDRADPLARIQSLAQQERAGGHPDDRDEIERQRSV